MVSQDSPSNNPSSNNNNTLHHFLISAHHDTTTTTNATNQPHPQFDSCINVNDTFLQVLEPLSSPGGGGGANYHIQSLGGGHRMSRSINHHQDHHDHQVAVPSHDDEMMMMMSTQMRRSSHHDHNHNHQQQAMDFLGAHHLINPPPPPPHDQPNNRLSLSLGYQQAGRLFSTSTPPPTTTTIHDHHQYRSWQQQRSAMNNSDLVLTPQQRESAANYNLVSSNHHHEEENHNNYSSRFLGTTGFSNSPFVNNIVGNSRYLKPAQSLLEEVVNVSGKGGVDLSELKRLCLGNMGSLSSSSELRAELMSLQQQQQQSDDHDEEKQGLQIKLSKLISLLEEVESRYEDYCYRMEQLVSSFEVTVGEGAAKIYTALALQAMSRHFSSLKNAILCQIKTVRKKILPIKSSSSSSTTARLLSRLSLFDNRGDTATGNRSLALHHQQLGGQRRAWRPIRGLPETSVAILRAWLFEHFLHPYPNDSEKLILSSQTGLSKNQVSNWFINARVRLWKPMIEEMYKEEFGDDSADSDSMFSTNSASREVQSTDHGED